MKKLIPALAMLLVAAALMGTSTYAWFSANENVTASGMSVKAATSGGLAISYYTGTAGTLESAATPPTDLSYGSAAVLGDDAWTLLADGATVSPVSFNPTNKKWASATAANNENGAGVTSTYKDLALDTEGNVKGYYQKALFSIKSMDTTTATYKLSVNSISVTNTTAADKTASTALNRSLRVAVVTDTHVVVFAPNSEATQASDLCYVGTITKDGEGKVTAVETPDFTAAQLKVGKTYTDAVIYNTLGSTAIDVDVYVYYDGEDANCTTKNAMNIDTLSVEIEFIAAKNS